jgi:lipopolysaccharide transport system ATP-binding protein
MSGRVSALLELGIGFHPYLTGRQNAFMAGSLIGLSRDDVARLMPEIEAFAEIGEYIDQPVRVYSSGMQARLAFSVATAVRPDVLIVDEVLSVGDAYFQHKSFDRIREFRKRGTTLLIVSHDKQAIQSICDRAILLDSGRLATIGKPEAVLDYYNALLSRHQNPQIVQSERSDGRMKTVSGTGEATIEDVSLLDMENNKLSLVAVGQKILISILVCVHQDIDSLVLGCGIKDRFGQMVFGTNTFNTRQVLTDLKKGERYVYTISFSANLGVGSYSIHASLVRNSSHIERNYQWLDGAVVFEVFNKDKVDFVGCCWNEMNFAVNKVLE